MIGFVVAGFIVGALAQLVRRSKQQLGVLATFGLGLVGSLVGVVDTPSVEAKG